MLDKCKRSCNLCGDLAEKKKVKDSVTTRVKTTNSIDRSTTRKSTEKETSLKILTQITTKKFSNSECFDLIDYCLQYFQSNQCVLEKQSMEYYCKKTCNFC
jgi:hypothetical protein